MQVGLVKKLWKQDDEHLAESYFTLSTITHNLCGPRNVRAFMLNVTYIVSIVTIQYCSGTSYTHLRGLQCMHHSSIALKMK